VGQPVGTFLFRLLHALSISREGASQSNFWSLDMSNLVLQWLRRYLPARVFLSVDLGRARLRIRMELAEIH
jgi:hypothetical protein